jgi:hypothetical protein
MSLPPIRSHTMTYAETDLVATMERLTGGALAT